ncbi:cytochrome P450 [Phyllosticta paracitricarpa]|uniref:Cytochrome P450 n=1 Tax=Phyllosticta paracitricarpa TaxID=2016321 RepID=A0ABR1NG35_9PEZI
MLGARTYTVTSPALVVAVTRASKTISFRPFIAQIFTRLASMDSTVHKINMDSLGDPNGLLARSHEIVNNAVLSGPVSDGIARELLRGIAANVNGWGRGGVFNLADIPKQLYGDSTLNAIFGPGLLEQDAGLPQAYWDWDSGLVELIFAPLPWLTYRRAYLGRRRLHRALERYMYAGQYKQACQMLQDRVALHTSLGYSLKMAGYIELGMIIASYPNSTYSAFWFLCHVFADPSLLQEMRQDVAPAVERKDDKAVVNIDAARIRCPLLQSTFRELLRLYEPTSSWRTVLEDTRLDQYLVKKGSLILLEGGLLHTKPAIWGADALDFNPRRFIDSPSGTRADGTPVHPASFRGFGGGNVYCPGRNVAHVEMFALMVVLVVGFEAEGVDGPLVVPPLVDDVIPLGVGRPRWEPKVKISRRKGWEDVVWDFQF